MKNTKKLAALLLAAIMVMALAACGNKSANEGSDSLYVGTAMQDEGTAEPAESAEPAVESSPVMAAVYDNFVNGERFGEIQEMYMGYAHFETALKGDTIELIAISDNEWYDSMNGSWEYVLDGDYISLTTSVDSYTGVSVFSCITTAVAEYLGMDPELVGLYTTAVASQELDSKYFVIDYDTSTRVITEKIYVAGPFDMQDALDTAYITEEQAADMGPLGENSTSTVMNAGKVSMAINGSRDSVDFDVAEYGGNTDLTYKSLISAVKAMQPVGYEDFLANYTALEEVETEQYQVKFLTDEDEIPFAFEDFGDNYRFVQLHFGEVE